MQDMQEIDVGPKRPEVYRSGDEFVKALANQLEIPDSFFDEHNALKRAVGDKDIQDPRVWVRAVVPSENAKPLNASLDSSSMYLHFSSKGEMPENISAKSKSGEYINLLLAEAKFQAVQKVMPETYATGHWKVSRAIKEVRALRKAVVNSPSRFELSSLLSPSESGRIRLGRAIPITIVSAGLILSACGPNVIVPPIPIADSVPDRSTLTQAAPSATKTATATETAKVYTVTATELVQPTPTKEKEIKLFQVTKDFAEKDKMSVITLEDLKSGSSLLKWEQSQIDKIGPIANDPARIDYLYWAPLNSLAILDHHLEGNPSRGVQSTEFFSFYKINLAPWGFPKNTGFVVTYAYEDIAGKLTPTHFFMTEKQANDYINRDGVSKSPRSRRLSPISVMGSGAKNYLVDGKVDLRPMADTFYTDQGYTVSEVIALFQRITDSDIIADSNKAMFESIIFISTDGIVVDAELH